MVAPSTFSARVVADAEPWSVLASSPDGLDRIAGRTAQAGPDGTSGVESPTTMTDFPSTPERRNRETRSHVLRVDGAQGC